MEVGSRIIHLAVYKAVIDIDDPVLEIQVLLSEAKALADSHPASDQNSNDRFPSLILMVGIKIVHECFLLRYRERLTLGLNPYMTLLDLSENSGCRVYTDESVTHCHLECRMKHGMNVIDCCRRKLLLQQKRIVVFPYIRITNLYQPPLSEGLPDIVVIGINVIRPGRRLEVVFLFDVRIEYLVDCNTLCSLGIQYILQIASDLLLLLSKFHEIFSVDGVTFSVSVSVRIRVTSVCPLTLTTSERIAAGVLPALYQSVYLLFGEAQIS